MKLFELHDKEMDFKPKLDFDVADDLLTYMRNDKQFYRKQYYPMMVSLQDDIQKGRDIDYKERLAPMIDSACGKYTKQYKLPVIPEELLDESDREKLISAMMDEEQDLLRKGDY